jgi:hypothetical protein
MREAQADTRQQLRGGRLVRPGLGHQGRPIVATKKMVRDLLAVRRHGLVLTHTLDLGECVLVRRPIGL